MNPFHAQTSSHRAEPGVAQPSTPQMAAPLDAPAAFAEPRAIHAPLVRCGAIAGAVLGAAIGVLMAGGWGAGLGAALGALLGVCSALAAGVRVQHEGEHIFWPY
jgi:hypothetical protein